MNLKESKTRNVKIAIALIVIAGSWLVFIGYLTNSMMLKALGTNSVTMKVVTAFMFFLSGLTLLLGPEYRKKAAVVIILTAIYTFTSWVLNEAKPLFLPVFEEVAGFSIKGDVPSWPTLVSFICFGLYYIVYQKWLAWVIFIISIIAFFGHIVEAPTLYYYIEGYSTGQALNTALLFILLSIFILLTKTNKPWEEKSLVGGNY